VIIAARKALGPLMIVVGLGLIGLVPLRLRLGQRIARRLSGPLRARGAGGAFLLGVLPLALKSTAGWAFPGLFALGASLPLLAVTGLVVAGVGAVDVVAGGIKRLERPLRAIAAVVLVLAGLHDTVVYWLL